ncbi:MAG TPA: zinc-binding dehydrogenase [Gaiellaceae bacterium]|nr:zinc-binding dehydrogenase [Gaiellaceae bacterium]
MQAVVLREPGGPEVLRPEAVADPEPGPEEVVVELRAAAVNRRDLRVRDGAAGFEGPLVPGSDGAGVVRGSGDEVVVNPSLHWGDGEAAPGPAFEILGGPSDGTYAELVKVPRANVCPKPSRLSWQEAAALPLAGLTAYRALFSRGRLRGGETVLLLGAGSGVTTFAVQLAVQEGARVLVTSSRQEKLDRAAELGASGGVLYTDDAWPDAVRELTGGTGVDLVLDSVGATWAESLRCLRPGGRLVSFGATGGNEARLEPRSYYGGQYSLLGTMMGSPRDFAGLLRVVNGGAWKPVIDSVRPLAEAADAHRRLESGEQFGKLVLELG